MPNSTQVTAAIAGLGGALGINVLNPLATDWMILYAGTQRPLLVPDTVFGFEYRGESRVCDYPIEPIASQPAASGPSAGAGFVSYNKVAVPFDIRIQMVCAGGPIQSAIQSAVQSIGLNLGPQYQKKGVFLDTLDYMQLKTVLVDIVTPDHVYKNTTLVHYDYKREARSGATILIIEAAFREVRIAGASTYTNSNSVSAADPVVNGTVQTTAGTGPIKFASSGPQ